MNEWISVKDRLPENDEEVLALLKSGTMDIGWVEPENRHQCSTKNKEFITRSVDGIVTHWMSLPEPPKPEGLFIWENNCLAYIDSDGEWLGRYDFGELHQLPQDFIDWLNTLPRISLEKGAKWTS